SDLAFDDCPENIQYGEISASSVPDQVELFNNFFTNVESSSFSTEDESSKNIFEKFKEQHGFRSGFSCQTGIHEFISYINNALGQKLITLALFIDLRKAFDLIDSLVLLLKLFHYGYDNNSLGLMSYYFNNSSQIVKLQNTHSKPSKLKYGVRQGSVFGPLLFLIFINDLPLCILRAFIELFADDTTLAKSRKKLEKILKDFDKKIEDLN
ncbi:unnamed protein product, partial [Brachionus calyciflorus]